MANVKRGFASVAERVGYPQLLSDGYGFDGEIEAAIDFPIYNATKGKESGALRHHSLSNMKVKSNE